MTKRMLTYKKIFAIFWGTCLVFGLMIPTIVVCTSAEETEPFKLVYSKIIDWPSEYGMNPTQFIQSYSVEEGSLCFITGAFMINGTSIPTLWKVDSDFNIVWNRSFIHPVKPRGFLRSIIETSNGGFALSGLVESSIGDEYDTWDLWVIRTDRSGNEVWNRTFNGPQDSFDYGSQILETEDGGFLVSGGTGTVENVDIDYWLIKLDENGTEQWNKTYHRIGVDQATSLVPLNDGNYLIGGLSAQYVDSANPHSIWVIKIDGNGTVSWDIVLEFGSDTLGAWERSLIGTQDGGFFLSYYQRASLYVGKDYLVAKVSADGKVEWERAIGGVGFDTPCACLQDDAGDFYIGGSYNSYRDDADVGDFCLMKLSRSGQFLGLIRHGDSLMTERIVDMKFFGSSHPNNTIIACAYVREAEDWSTARCWFGLYDYYLEPNTSTTPTTTTTTATTSTDSTSTLTTSTAKKTPFIDSIFILFCITILYLVKRPEYNLK